MMIATCVLCSVMTGLLLMEPQVEGAEPSMLYVGGIGPGNYTSIQKAINSAAPGDTVYLYSGVYTEQLMISSTLVTIQGEDRDTTIIDGAGRGNVINVTGDRVFIRDVTVRNSNINLTNASRVYAGIYLVSTSSRIMHCHITQCHLGIIFDGASLSRIMDDCLLSENAGGIDFYNTENCTILNCTISSNIDLYGLSLRNSHNNIIAGCLFSDHETQACLFGQSSSNIVFDNIFQDNTVGMWLFRTDTKSSHDNEISYNTFNDSTCFDYCGNLWDNGVQGNYWSDYTGEDSNSDGIGDTAYPIPGGQSQDRYPLMIPPKSSADSDSGGEDNDTEPVNTAPVASFTYDPTNPQDGDVITFSDTSMDADGTIVSWNWDFDDGTGTSTLQHPSYSYNTAGVYNVSLTITDDEGAIDTITNTIIIESLPSLFNGTTRIRQPLEDEVVNGTVLIKGTASADVPITEVLLRIDTGEWKVVEGTLTWDYVWNTSAYSNGVHTLSARCSDGMNYSSITTLTVTVYNTPQEPQNGNNGDHGNDSVPGPSLGVLLLLVCIALILLVIRRR